MRDRTNRSMTGSWVLIALHDDTLGRPTGGTRMQMYRGPAEALEDAQRLAEGMTHKWAAVGLLSKLRRAGPSRAGCGGRFRSCRRLADAASSGFAALFGVFPTTSYSQNVGLVNFKGVTSRHVTALAGGMLVVLGPYPKVGALSATIPP